MLVEIGVLSLLAMQTPEESWAWAIAKADDGEKPLVEAILVNRIEHPDFSTETPEKRRTKAQAFLEASRALAAKIGPDDRIVVDGDVFVRDRDGQMFVDAREKTKDGITFVAVNFKDRDAIGTPEQQQPWLDLHAISVSARRALRPDDTAIIDGGVVLLGVADVLTVLPPVSAKGVPTLTLKPGAPVLPRDKVPVTTTKADAWRIFLQGRPAKAPTPNEALAALAPAYAAARDDFAKEKARIDAEGQAAAARAAKPGPVDFTFLVGWGGDAYDFKRKGYPLEWQGVTFGALAIVPEKGGSLFLPVEPDLAEQQVSWRFATGRHLFLRVHGKKLGAVSGQEAFDQAMKKAKGDGLVRMTLAADGPGRDELRLQVDSIDVLGLDGSVIGTALPVGAKKH